MSAQRSVAILVGLVTMLGLPLLAAQPASAELGSTYILDTCGRVAAILDSVSSEQPYTVPAGVTKVRLRVEGGAGHDWYLNNRHFSGGRGSVIEAEMDVTPGEKLESAMLPGPEGGASPPGPDTGEDLDSVGPAGGNGGAAGVWASLDNRGCLTPLLVAAGGGGAGGDPDIADAPAGASAGGDADTGHGGGHGGDGGTNDAVDGAGGGGATRSGGGSGGAAGHNAFSICYDGSTGEAGGLVQGGSGGGGHPARKEGGGTSCHAGEGAGGGGAGYHYGGGGGSAFGTYASGGGGGGSPYVADGLRVLTNELTAPGVWAPDPVDPRHLASPVGGGAVIAMPEIDPIYQPPGAPTSVTASPHDKRADVTFTKPSNLPGPIASYLITASPGGRTATVPGDGPYTGTVTGLTNGTAYRFTVQAVPDGLIDGTAPVSSLSQPVTPRPDAPGPVSNVHVTPGDASASITFTAPTDNGGSPVTHYSVSCDWCDDSGITNTTGLTVTGLTNGHDHTVTIYAMNVTGAGTPVTVHVTPTASAAPGKPGKPTVSPRHNGAVVSFVPAERGDDRFTVTASPSVGAPVFLPITYSYAGGQPLAVRVDGLTDGTPYTFTVTARNDKGSTTSDPSDATSPNPTAPEIVAADAVSGNASALVTIRGFSNDGGVPITSYTATARDETFTPVTSATLPVASTPQYPLQLTIPNLTNGERYTVTVHAHNALGDGVESFIGQVFPHGPPPQPTNVTATVPVDATGEKARVSFTTPNQCVGYVVTASPGGETNTGTTGACSARDITVGFGGLTNGTAYTFSVHFSNDMGDSPESLPSNAVTPHPTTTPGVPTDVVAAPAGSGKLRLTWTAPTDDGGAPIIDYSVRWSATDVVTVSGSSDETVIDGLHDGTSYTFEVTARNVAGLGFTAGSNVATPFALAAPTDVSVTGGYRAIAVAFAPSADNGGGALTYILTVTRSAFDHREVVATASPVVVSGLEDQSDYTVTVRAHNDDGDSPESDPVDASTRVDAPSQPRNVTASAGIGEATVSFEPVEFANAFGTMHYTVVTHPGGTLTPFTPDQGQTAPYTVRLTGLQNGTPYRFTVFATNVYTDGLESAPSNEVTPNRLVQSPITLTPTSGTYGDHLQVMASGGSGDGAFGPITATGNACHLDLGALELTSATDAAHTCTLTVEKAGDDTHQPASVTRIVTIGRRTLTVTAADASMTYGGTLPSLTAAITGFLDRDGVGLLGGTLACVPSGLHAGANAINCGGLTAANYAFDYVPGVLSVAKSVLVVQVFGEQPRGGSPTYAVDGTSGLLGTDTEAVLGGTLTCTSAVTPASGFGAYAISACAGLTARDYSITYVLGSLFVTRGALTVHVAGTQVAGEAPSYAVVGVDGLATGDGPEVLLGALSCTSAAGDDRAPGDYDILHCTGLSASDYAVSYELGTLRVSARQLRVLVDGAQTYGGTPTYEVRRYDGFIDGDGPDALVGSLTCTSDAMASSPVGLYRIAGCSGLTASRYSIDYVLGLVHVGPAMLQVEVAGTQPYGGTPTFRLVGVHGLVNGESADVLDGVLSCDGVVAKSGVGEHPITGCVGLHAANYVVTYLLGAVDVAPRPLLVHVSGSQTFGGTPSYEVESVEGLVEGDTASVLAGTLTCSSLVSAASAVGSYAISSCSGLAASNYFIAYVPGTLAVEPAPLTVHVSGSQTYGGTASFSIGAVAGLVNGESTSVLTGTLACTTEATSTSGVGDHPILACSGLAAANHTVDYALGKVHVAPRTASVSAEGSTRTYGSANGPFTAVVSGVVNGDALSFTLTTSATAASPVGTYVISVSLGSNPNYDVTTSGSVLSVTRATLTITASSTASVYGTVPSVTPRFSGFVGGDAPSDLDTAPTCATAVTATTGAGSHPGANTCSGATDHDYAFVYRAGDASVGKATLTVTGDDKSRLFGAVNPTLTATITGFVNNQTVAATSGLPSCSTTALRSSTGGSYPITCSAGTLSAANYSFRYLPGSLVVRYSAPCLTGATTKKLVIARGEAICIGAGFKTTAGVVVETGGALDIVSGTVKTSIGAPLSATGASAVRVCGSTISGQVDITGTTGPVVLGDGAGCAGNALGSSVTVQSNAGGVAFVGNTVGGSLTIGGNGAPQIVSGNQVNGKAKVT